MLWKATTIPGRLTFANFVRSCAVVIAGSASSGSSVTLTSPVSDSYDGVGRKRDNDEMRRRKEGAYNYTCWPCTSLATAKKRTLILIAVIGFF
jgi:hypothetical protein